MILVDKDYSSSSQVLAGTVFEAKLVMFASKFRVPNIQLYFSRTQQADYDETASHRAIDLLSSYERKKA